MSTIGSLILTGSAHVSKIFMGLFLLKIMAVYIGPDGVGKLGHIMSFVTILSILSGGGVTNALIKYCSEYHQNPKELLKFIAGAANYALFFSLIVCVVMIVMSRPLSQFIFGDDNHKLIIVLLAFTQLALAFINVVYGVANGLFSNKVFAYSQIIGNLLAIPLIFICISNYLVSGAEIAIVLASTLCFLPALFFYYRSFLWGRIRVFKINMRSFRQLFPYTIMLVFSTMAFPLVEIAVRNLLISNVGYHDVGIWQAAIRFSSAYLGFFTMFLAFYFVPRISPESSNVIVGKITLRYMYLVQILFFLVACILYLGRHFFIALVYSEEFSQLADLIGYQLIGDFFKISAYVIGFIAVAKAAIKLYIIAEIFQGGLFFLGVWFISRNNLDVESVLIVYVVTYFLYYVICLGCLRLYMRNRY